jgi:hypothetical protein
VIGKGIARAALILVAIPIGVPAGSAQDAFKLDFHGSLGEGPGKHQRYVPPLANPLFNETPYITTELRPIYIHQRIPREFLTRGGDINIWAAEIRVALTERLGIIASKDGFADIDFDRGLPDTSGFANISAGLKYALHSDPKDQSILSLGIEYEPTTGDINTGGINLQGGGSGFVDLFVTGAKAWGKLGLQASLGVNLALDSAHDSSLFHWSGHADYELLPNFFPLFEINGFTTIDNGRRTRGVNFEGVDLVNFGSTESGTVVTLTGGFRYRFSAHIQMGVGYESTVTDRRDLLDDRIYVDLVISY